MTPLKLRAALLLASFAGIPGAVPRGVGVTDTDLAILTGQVRATIDGSIVVSRAPRPRRMTAVV